MPTESATNYQEQIKALVIPYSNLERIENVPLGSRKSNNTYNCFYHDNYRKR